MTKVSHFEVYKDSGSGWKLVERFSAEDRALAFNYAKDKVRENSVGIKIIKETFDNSDGSYSETVEFVKALKDERKNTFSSKKIYEKTNYNQIIQEKINKPKFMQSIFIMFLIIIGSAVIANVIGSLLLPVIESYVHEELVKTTFLISLFAVFMLIAIPLMLHKIPWHSLSITAFNSKNLDEESFYSKADGIVKRYNLNEDFADDRTPIEPQANHKDKVLVINFIAEVLSVLRDKPLNSFNKLGIYLILYGGILELCEYKKLKSSQLNTLMHKAVLIIEGKDDDLVDFYKAKKTYKDNKYALYLTGLGAFLMDKHILKQPIDTSFLKTCFGKWEKLGKASEDSGAEKTQKNDADKQKINLAEILNVASFKYGIKLFDNSSEKSKKQEKQEAENIKSIIAKQANKFECQKLEVSEDIISYVFTDLAISIAFSKHCLQEVNAYIEQLSDENLIFNIKANIVKKQTNNDNSLYIKDLFEYTNDDEVLTTYNIVEEAKEETNLSFQSFGKKLLPSVSKTVELFKIL